MERTEMSEWLSRIVAAKKERRRLLAALPIEEKIRILVQLQELAAPILRGRGRQVRAWEIPPTGGRATDSPVRANR